MRQEGRLMNSRVAKALLGATLILFVAVAVLLGMLLAPRFGDLYGTYCTGAQIAGGDLYIVLQKDHSYRLYKQFEPLEDGTYEVARTVADLSVLSLAAQGVPSESTAVCDGSRVILLPGGAKDAIVFEKMSDTPTFINLGREGD